MAITLEISGKRCLHPGDALDAALRHGTPFEFSGRANSYTCPLGKEPGSAWVLMLRRDFDSLSKDAFHSLFWADGRRILRIPALCIVRSLTMNRALPGDKKAARLVELRDRRHLLGMSSINRQYNVRRPAPNATSGSAVYYEESLNSVEQMDGGTVWTWQEIVDDIWQKLPGTTGEAPAAGTAPTLPFTPDGTPEGFRFIGVSAWDALHVVLEKIGCTTAYNPITDTFSYVQLGATQTGLTSALTNLSGLIYDYDPDDGYNLSSIPETVRVFFHRREQYHGIEKDTVDTDNWEMTPSVSKDFVTGVGGAQSGSVMAVWDDLPALFDATGDNTNSADLQTRASEVGQDLRNKLLDSAARMRKIYSGLVTSILPGEQVSEVIWRDYGDQWGLVTEIMRRPKEKEPRGISHAGESIAPPDLARHTHPLWPRLAQIVQVDDGSSSIGADVSPNASGLIPGVVKRWADGAYSNLGTCWIRPTDLEFGATLTETNVVKLRQKDRLVGRLSGVETVSGDTRPVYLVRRGESSKSETKIANTNEVIPKFDSATLTPGSGFASVFEFAGDSLVKTTEFLEIFNWEDFEIPTDEFVLLHQELATGKWMIQTDGQHTIEGASPGSDGQETLFPYDTLQVVGDRDQTAVVGNIIDVNITKNNNVVKLLISSTGGVFTVTADEAKIPSGTSVIDLGDDLEFSTDIDPANAHVPDTQMAVFTLGDVVGGHRLTLWIGRMFKCDADSGGGPVQVSPLETIDLEGGTNVTTTVNKLGDRITWTIDASGGTSSWDLRDNQPAPNTITVEDQEVLQFISSIDETQLSDWLLWEAVEGVPDTMEAIFGRMAVVSDFDSSVNFFPTEEVKFTTINPSGNVAVTKALDTVTVEIDLASASGTWTLRDNQPTPNDVGIDAGETLQFLSSIDETQLNDWLLWEAVEGAPDTLEAIFGRMLIASDHDSSVNVFPTEEIKFTTVNPSQNVAVSKAGDVTTVEIDLASSSGGWTLRDDTGPTDVTIDAGETLQFTTTIDETQTGIWAEWNAAEGAPDTMELSFGLMLAVSDHDSSVNVFPTETLKFTTINPSQNVSVAKAGDTTTVEIDLASVGGGFHNIQDGDLDSVVLNDSETFRIRGDRDVTVAVGNFIETEVVDLGTTIQMTINAVGDMFRFETETLGVIVAAAETISLSTAIDEVGLPTTFAEVRGSGNNLTWAFGRMFSVTDGSAVASMFPNETLQFATSNPAGNVQVSKAGDITTVDIDLSAGGVSHTIKDGDGDTATLFNTETLELRGDRDNSTAVGNIIETEVVDNGATVTVTFNALGGLFTVIDNNSPQGSSVVELADNWNFTSSIDETMTTKLFEWQVANIFGNTILNAAFGKLFGVKDDSTTVNLFPLENLHFQTINPSGNVEVQKVGDDVDVTIDLGGSGDGLPIGTIIESSKPPRLVGSKYYIDRNGSADTNWALMDGVSNANPGDGQNRQGYFVRGLTSSTTPNDNPFGRTDTALTNSDEVGIGVADHADHFHEIFPDICHGPVTGTDTHFDFTSGAGKLTTGAVDGDGFSVGLEHSMDLTNNQATGDNIEMLPAHKKTHWYERVA